MSAKKPKKIGLALGGGAAKGLAHIGVIKELERAGIEISFISGTSMGALIGGFYAATKDIALIEKFFMKLRHKDIYPVFRMIRKKDGAIFKNHLMQELEKMIEGIKIDDCKIPFSAVATDVENGDEVIIKKGNLSEAIRASSAIPIVFPPVKTGGRLLMDGGLVNPIPANVARDMGADFVIAVDVSSRWLNFEETDFFSPTKIYAVMPYALSIIGHQLSRKILAGADVVIAPPVLGYKLFHFADAEEIIKKGASEARNKMHEIFKTSGHIPPKKSTFDKVMDFILYQD